MFSASRRQIATTPANDAASCVRPNTYQDRIRVGPLRAEGDAAHGRGVQAPRTAWHIVKRQTLHQLAAPEEHIDPAPTRLCLGQHVDVR